jgi:hypothetical protein
MECLLSQAEVVTRRWHERLGHINYQAMKKMSREGLVRGLPDMVSIEHPCGACLEEKQRRSMIPAQAQYRAEMELELVHGDLCGKITPPTLAGNEYFLLMVDDRSRFMSIVLLKSKSQAP